ncbi:MAG: DEAD/DEAH box helicase [Anaeroplasmataceae bacterium]
MENGFLELNVEDAIVKALDELNINMPSEIQSEAIPALIEGLDVIGQAQTGTGKTFAYGIPTIMKISKSKDIEALVLCPTRELALQVSGELQKLIKYKSYVKIATVYGGESYEKQIRALKNHPQIVVGTPGRIIDLMNRGVLSFAHIHTLVLDEADEMLKMGFQEDLEFILSTTPSSRQTALFSATMPIFIKNVASKYQHNPLHIVIKKKTLTVDKINQDLYYCKRESKNDLLIRLLDYYDFKSCIIFANTKSKVDELVLFLQKNNYQADGIHGDLKQLVRDRVMNAFRNGATKYLVATDVAARGIDVTGLEAIINFDLPNEDELYVHRIGRTGRAGLEGHSISIASPSERNRVKMIEAYTKKSMTQKEIPSIKEIYDKQANRLFDNIISNLDTPIENNLMVLNKLAASENDSVKIINALINILMDGKRKNYNEIEIVRNKREHKINHDGRQPKNFKPTETNNYIYAHLNIGKKELLRPQILLSFMEKTVGVRKSNVGDIVIRKSGTTLEITKAAFAYLKKLDGKSYQGTRIRVMRVLYMD